MMSSCQVCGINNHLQWCSSCHLVQYCSKDHQKQDWKSHKLLCKMSSQNGTRMKDKKTAENHKLPQTLQWATTNSVKLEAFSQEDVTEHDKKMVEDIWQSMEVHGLCILNKFLPEEQAEMVYSDVLKIYNEKDSFVDGEIVKQGSNLGPDRVRGDRIHWGEEDYRDSPAVKILCRRLDKIVHLFACRSGNVIQTRTKPMIACYPGNGASYKRHVDNPAEDGRILTCLYYLNKEWKKEYGGNLMLYPKGLQRKVICEPSFNRIIIFFSDGRNPHEVAPTFKERFAITCWYFERDQRERAVAQWRLKNSLKRT